jgi:thiosulfate dehydrogenase [quinone] large subunit
MERLDQRQQIALVALRTVIGWHFLYEGYFKLVLPAWGRAGKPLAAWSAAGYLKASSGPVADLFRSLADSKLAAWIDVLVPVGLLLVGLSLMLGLFTQAGCWGGLALLAVFYLSAIPTAGAPQTGNEGTYLFVNKNLVEAAALFVVLSFKTGEIAGLDLLLQRSGRTEQPVRAAS